MPGTQVGQICCKYLFITLVYNFLDIQLKPLVAILYMTVFCVVSPIGVGVGMALTDPSQEGEMTTNALIVLQGLATGSLLYVVFFEILEKERQKPVPGVLQAR